MIRGYIKEYIDDNKIIDTILQFTGKKFTKLNMFTATVNGELSHVNLHENVPIFNSIKSNSKIMKVTSKYYEQFNPLYGWLLFGKKYK